MNETKTEQKPDTVGRIVRLLKCGKQRCSHILTADEYVSIPHPKYEGTTCTCPKCGGESFWMLDKNGRVTSLRDSEEIDANDIEPSPRMGLKMRRRILAAKRRALI